MAVDVSASRFGPDVTLASSDVARGPDRAPHVAWDRVDRRQTIAAPLTVAPEFTAMPVGGTSPDLVLSSELAAGAPAERRFGLNDRRWRKKACGAGEASHASGKAWKVRDVAGFLQASESWVRHAAAAGQLPCTKIGGLLRFDADEIRSLARADAPARVLSRKR